MSVPDNFIQARETLLNWIIGVQSNEVLNLTRIQPSQNPGVDLAAELKRAMDQIKTTAIDTHGREVNYANLRTSRVYQKYRGTCSPRLREFNPAGLNSHKERIAFWVNLYNALVLDAVVSFGVHHSVAEGRLGILGFFRRAAYNVCGHRLSCDDIEHGILRGNRGHPLIPGPQFASGDLRQTWVIFPPDPRIHFALNCASRSCPPIQVYTPKDIDAQLDLAARNFVNTNLSLDTNRNQVSISAIFNWYQGDFGGREGVIDHLLYYLPEGERRTWLSKHRQTIRFKYQPYDWKLNDLT